MQRLLGALLALLISGTAAFADSTPGALGVATSTLVGGKLPFDQGPGTDTALGFTTTQFCLTGGALVICNSAITNAMLAGSIDPAKLTAGTGVAAALGINVGSAGAFLKNNGDAITGTYTGAPTFSGNLTFSGIPKLTGLSTGTQVFCLGLDSGNNIVLLTGACGTGGGSGNVTAAGTLTSGQIVIGQGTTAVAVDASAGLVAGALTLGASGTAGSVAMGNATSGTVTLQPVAGALGSVTASLPANTGTIAELNLAQTWTAKQTFTGSGPIEAGANSGNVGSIKLYGSASGDATITVPAAAGTATRFQLPATNGSNTNVLQTDGSGNTSWAAAGGGSVSVTAATPNVVITPSPGIGTFTIGSTSPQHDISGSGVAIVAADDTKLVKLGAFTYTLAQAGTTGFGSGWSPCLVNVGAGNATINATTSTFVGAGGSTSLVLVPGAWACPTSDGTNYQTMVGSDIVAGTGVTVTRNADGTTTIAATGGSSVAPIPQGRLTLQSTFPVMTADQTAKTTIYYDTYVGNVYPNWNGSAMANVTITSDEISMGLDAGSHIVSGSLYDVFGTASATICAGPAWTSTSARGTGAGTTELQLKSGVWTNKNSLTNCWGGAAGVTDRGAIAANQGTYLGTFYATANGQTGVAFTPAPASGGSNTFVALSNAYNRVPIDSYSADSTSTWTYGTVTWRAANASNSNRITVVDGLAQSTVRARYDDGLDANASNQCDTAIAFDSVTTPATIGTASIISGLAGPLVSLSVQSTRPPLLGLRYIQALEQAGATCTYNGATIQGLFLNGFMM